MGRRKKTTPEEVPVSLTIPQTKARKARSLERREEQLIALAYDLVEERIRNGTATSQETVEFLRRGSTKAMLEKDILEQQKELMKAKTEALKSAKRVEELYGDAMKAFRSYQGTPEGKDEILS